MNDRVVHKGRAGLLAAATVAALLSVPSLTPASAADEVVQSAGHVVVPGKPLARFDISWVDPGLAEYFLADRSNSSIDVVPLHLNPPVFQIIPTGVNAFAGFTGNNDTSGPNGVITFNDPLSPVGLQLWAGDGPTANPVCGGGTCSTVKVFSNLGSPSSVITTGGSSRADELCWAPPITVAGITFPGTVLVANDADAPPFDSFIPTDNANGATPNVVSQRIGLSFATGGIEQCQYDGSVNMTGIPGIILQNIPVNGNGPAGITLIWARVGVAGTWTLVNAGTPNPNFCLAPQGMAIGPRGLGGFVGATLGEDQVLDGCNGTTTTVSVFKFAPGVIINIYNNAGGSDQVAYTSENPVGHYWTTSTTAAFAVQQVSQIDALQLNNTVTNSAVDAVFAIGMGGNSGLTAHSIASWAGVPAGLPLLEAVFVPVPAGGTSSIPFSSTVCGTDALKGCIAFGVITPLPPFSDEAGATSPF